MFWLSTNHFKKACFVWHTMKWNLGHLTFITAWDLGAIRLIVSLLIDFPCTSFNYNPLTLYSISFFSFMLEGDTLISLSFFLPIYELGTSKNNVRFHNELCTSSTNLPYSLPRRYFPALAYLSKYVIPFLLELKDWNLYMQQVVCSYLFEVKPIKFLLHWQIRFKDLNLAQDGSFV